MAMDRETKTFDARSLRGTTQMTAESSPAQTTLNYGTSGRRILIAIVTVVATIAGVFAFGVPQATAQIDNQVISAQLNAISSGGIANFRVSVRNPDNNNDSMVSVTSVTGAAGVSLAISECKPIDEDQTRNVDFSLQTTASTPATSSFSINVRQWNSGSVCEAGIDDDDTVSGGTLTVQVTQAPAITSANTATFKAGTVGTFTVTSTGNPARTYSAAPLPAGVSINAASGVLTSTTGAAAGTYNVTITASNGVSPAATQAFTLIILGPVTQLGFATQPTTVV
ncbi:MAG: Ig domain-containing protein, partial [Acidimicrobiia bacterium]